MDTPLKDKQQFSFNKLNFKEQHELENLRWQVRKGQHQRK